MTDLTRKTKIAITAEVDTNGQPVWGTNQNVYEVPLGQTSAAIENLRAGKRYWVKTWNEDLYGNKSPEVISVVDTPPDPTFPATPTGLTLTAASFGFRAEWVGNSEIDFDEYEVYVAPDNGSGFAPNNSQAEFTRVKTTTHWFEGEIGVKYWVRIRAFDTSGNASVWSSYATVTPFWLVPLLFGSTGVLDSDDPLYCFLSIPDEVSAITSVNVRLSFRPFAANARDAASSGTLTSTSGGGSTSGSGGGSTTADGGGHQHGVANFISNTPGGYSVRNYAAASFVPFPSMDIPTSAGADWATGDTADHHHTISSHTHSTPNHTHTINGHTHALTYGTFEESYPASHSVTVKTYKLVNGGWVLQNTSASIVDDLASLDLTSVIVGSGDWRLSIQSDAAQPNNGRLGCDVYGNITAVIGGSGVFDAVVTPSATYLTGALFIGGVEVFDAAGNLLVGSPPTGAAGGDLSGTYPNPQVVNDSHNHTSTTVTTHSTAHAHSSLTGIGADDHHAQSHDHSAAADGTTLNPAAINVTAGNVVITDTASNSRLQLTDHAWVQITTDGAHAILVGHAATASNFPFRIDHDGKHEWGDNTNPRDTNLYRSAADTLKTDDALIVSGALTVGGNNVQGSTAGPDANATVDSAGAAGTSGTFARSGHGHQIVTTAGPGADDTIDAAGAAGATGAVARAGHGHKLSTATATPAATTNAGGAGTSGTAPSRGDHAHPQKNLTALPVAPATANSTITAASDTSMLASKPTVIANTETHRVIITGIISFRSNNPADTITFKCKDNAGTALATVTITPPVSTAISNKAFRLQLDLRAGTVSASVGNMRGLLTILEGVTGNSDDTTTGHNKAINTGNTLDSTAYDLTVAYSAANASNTMTVLTVEYERLTG